MVTDALTSDGSELRSASVVQRRLVLLASLSILVAFAGLIFWLGRTFEQTPWWVSAVFPAFGLGAAIKCFHTAKRLESNAKKAWLYFGLSYLSLGIGEAIWGIFDKSSARPIALPTYPLGWVGIIPNLTAPHLHLYIQLRSRT